MLCRDPEKIRESAKRKAIADNPKAQAMVDYYARNGINAL